MNTVFFCAVGFTISIIDSYFLHHIHCLYLCSRPAEVEQSAIIEHGPWGQQVLRNYKEICMFAPPRDAFNNLF